MISIYEAKDIKTKLSKDFELVGSDIFTETAAKYLKELDARVNELGLDYQQCREAAKMFKQQNFQGALEKIWGKNKIKVDTNHMMDGAVETYTYTVVGYGVFKEQYTRKNGNTYIHTITATYDDNPCPSYPLGTIISVNLKANNYNFEDIQERANKEAFLGRSTAAIYNILFVNYDGSDMSRVLSKRHLRLKNKL